VRPLVAYPLAFVLVLVAAVLAILYSVPGAFNGASLLLVLAIVAALVIVAKAKREHEAPTDDESDQTEPCS
jgi:hypothetical protein